MAETPTDDTENEVVECPVEGCTTSTEQRGLVSHIKHNHDVDCWEEAKELAGMNDDEDNPYPTTPTTPPTETIEADSTFAQQLAEFEERIEELRNLGLFEDSEEKLKELQAEVAQLRQDVDELLELKEEVEELKTLAERVDELESTSVTQDEAQYIAARAGPNGRTLRALRESVLDLRYHREWRVKCDNCDQWTVPGRGTPFRTHCSHCETELWQSLR
jgi:hypothetical protein